MRWPRRLAVACGVVALLSSAGCGGGGDAPPPPGDAGDGLELERLSPTGQESTEPIEEAQRDGFDECGLVEPAELAPLIGVATLYITGREVFPQPAVGGRLAACSYLTDDVPGISSMVIATAAGTDREQFFRPFADHQAAVLDGFGDHAELVAYSTPESGTHFREMRVIEGDIGLHIQYTYNESGSGMPALSDDEMSEFLRVTAQTALERMPDEVVILDGVPEGPCSGIDLGQGSEVLGGGLTASRSVVGSAGAVYCQFSGGEEAGLQVVVVTDPERVESMSASPDMINVPDIGEGAQVQFPESRDPSLDATVNGGDSVVRVIGFYGPGAGEPTAPRPEDRELVRSIVNAVSG